MTQERSPTPPGGAREEHEQAERLERLGRAAAGVAHEYNNLLTVILSCGHSLARAAEGGQPACAEDVKQLVEAAERARVLTRSLLALARRDASDATPLDPDEPIAPAHEPAAARAPPRGAETILLVEDGAALRRQALRALAGAGYQVHVAADGEEALAQAATLPRAPDLLLTGVATPRVDGRRLAETLRARWPGLPVVFIEGHADDRLDAHRRELPHQPLAVTGLLVRVREALDAVPPGGRGGSAP